MDCVRVGTPLCSRRCPLGDWESSSGDCLARSRWRLLVRPRRTGNESWDPAGSCAKRLKEDGSTGFRALMSGFVETVYTMLRSQ